MLTLVLDTLVGTLTNGPLPCLNVVMTKENVQSILLHSVPGEICLWGCSKTYLCLQILPHMASYFHNGWVIAVKTLESYIRVFH